MIIKNNTKNNNRLLLLFFFKNLLQVFLRQFPLDSQVVIPFPRQKKRYASFRLKTHALGFRVCSMHIHNKDFLFRKGFPIDIC